MQIDRDYELTHTMDVPEIAPLPLIRSERAATVARWFGIDDQINHPEPTPAPISAPTESSFVRSAQVRADHVADRPEWRGEIIDASGTAIGPAQARFLDLNEIQLPDVPLVDCFDGAPLDQTLALLSRVGLAEAWSYLRTPGELSEGQRWRLKLALGMREVGEGSGFRVQGSENVKCGPEPVLPVFTEP